MNNTKKQFTETAAHDTSASGERRRLGRIVHDERGTAIVEWHDAPGQVERDALSIEGQGPVERTSRRRGLEALSIRSEDSFNPYERRPGDRRERGNTSVRRDLRKLSEWIKMMRELEERKKNGSDE